MLHRGRGPLLTKPKERLLALSILKPKCKNACFPNLQISIINAAVLHLEARLDYCGQVVQPIPAQTSGNSLHFKP
jgi:hypothetical protein